VDGRLARVEPTPGGEFSVNIAGYGARGTFLEVDPPRRVTVSWGFEGSAALPPGSSTVSFTVEDGRITSIHLAFDRLGYRPPQAG
jgi:uncharacterized protein YndB with AHSA1/START domain